MDTKRAEAAEVRDRGAQDDHGAAISHSSDDICVILW